MFGKAMGNGYGITAVVGRREVMESAQTTFISSTLDRKDWPNCCFKNIRNYGKN